MVSRWERIRALHAHVDPADPAAGRCRPDATCGALSAVLLGLVVLVGLGVDPDGSRLGINLLPAWAARLTGQLSGLPKMSHVRAGARIQAAVRAAANDCALSLRRNNHNAEKNSCWPTATPHDCV